jgi:DNA-binding transcriptional regulator GbsR (MarR family)
MGNIYKLGDIDNEQFYILPKGLFINPKYQDISNTARIVYALLKDRMELSRQNGWHDDNGDIYLYFAIEEIGKLISTSRATVTKAMKELQKVELIKIVRQGLTKPNKIYISKLDEVYIKKDKNFTSGSTNSLHQEVKNFNTNDTDMSKTDKNDTDIGYSVSADTPTAPPKKPKKKFVPPSYEEVKAYITEKRLNVDAQKFFDYYEAGDWHDGNGKAVKSWKQKCLTWDKHDNGRQVRTQPQQVTTQPKDVVDTDVDWSKFDG